MDENVPLKIVKCPKCFNANDVTRFPRAYKFRCSNCGEILSMPGVKQNTKTITKKEQQSQKKTEPMQLRPKSPVMKKVYASAQKMDDDSKDYKSFLIKTRTSIMPLIITIFVLLLILGAGVVFIMKSKTKEQDKKDTEHASQSKQNKHTTGSTNSKDNDTRKLNTDTKKQDSKNHKPPSTQDEEISSKWESDPQVKEEVRKLVIPMPYLPQKEIEENIEKVKALGKPAIPALIEELDNSDSRVRRYAHRVLVEITGINKGDTTLAIDPEDRGRVILAWKKWWMVKRKSFKFEQESTYSDDDIKKIKNAIYDISQNKSYQEVEEAYGVLKKNSKFLIPILIELISISEKETSDYAFKLLKKITGCKLEKPSGDIVAYQKAVDEWNAWWEDNKNIFHPRRVEEELSKMRE